MDVLRLQLHTHSGTLTDVKKGRSTKGRSEGILKSVRFVNWSLKTRKAKGEVNQGTKGRGNLVVP